MSLSVLTDVALVAADLFVGYHVYGELQTVYQWWVHRPPPTPPTPPVNKCDFPTFNIPAYYKQFRQTMPASCSQDPPKKFITGLYKFTVGDFTIDGIYTYDSCKQEGSDYTYLLYNLTGWAVKISNKEDKCGELVLIARTDPTIRGHVHFSAAGNLSHGTGKGYLTKNKNYLNGQ